MSTLFFSAQDKTSRLPRCIKPKRVLVCLQLCLFQAARGKDEVKPIGYRGTLAATPKKPLLCQSCCGKKKSVIKTNHEGMSILQGKEDIFADCRKKFWNTYKTGLMYWPFVQLSNFSLVPVYLRTAYTGLCGFIWAVFLCFSQQSGDGTASSAFKIFQEEETEPDKTASPGK